VQPVRRPIQRANFARISGVEDVLNVHVDAPDACMAPLKLGRIRHTGRRDRRPRPLAGNRGTGGEQRE